MTPQLSRATYLLVYAALMALLVATAVAARFDLGLWNTVLALGIAAAKALLVLLYFMHVRFSHKVIWLAAAAGFFWLAILFTLSLGDYLTRGYLHIPGK